LANRGERRRMMRPRTSKPLGGILGDVAGRIVPVAPPPIAKVLGKVAIAPDEKQSTNRHPD
jgi:hypothetical protein